MAYFSGKTEKLNGIPIFLGQWEAMRHNSGHRMEAESSGGFWENRSTRVSGVNSSLSVLPGAAASRTMREKAKRNTKALALTLLSHQTNVGSQVHQVCCCGREINPHSFKLLWGGFPVLKLKALGDALTWHKALLSADSSHHVPVSVQADNPEPWSTGKAGPTWYLPNPSHHSLPSFSAASMSTLYTHLPTALRHSFLNLNTWILKT